MAREGRRGRRYDGLVLDPPSYGHGDQGRRAWQIDADLPDLLDACRSIVSDDGFVLLTAHTETFGPERLGAALAEAWGRGAGADRDRRARARQRGRRPPGARGLRSTGRPTVTDPPIVTSTANPRVKAAVALRERRERARPA